MRLHFKLFLFGVLLSELGAIGTQFLSIPPSARDLIYFNSSWRNPSLLNQVNLAPELSLAYGDWLAGVQTFGFRWKGQIKNGSGGIDIRYVGLDDIELRPDKPTAKPLGHYAAYGVSAKGTYSWTKGSFQLGIGLKLLNFQIYQEKSNGTALDFGLGWQPVNKIQLNISALNLGKMGKMISDSPQLPRQYIGCLLYTSPSPRDRQKSRMPSSA